jgi:hypothetical protein
MILPFLLAYGGAAGGAEIKPTPFPAASIHLEQNATDGDMEVVIEITGTNQGLSELNVVTPDGRQAIAFKAPGSSKLGIREFRFESPEPRDPKSIKAAYPEGIYEFSGKTSSGDNLVGKATLTHGLPPTTKLVTPARAAEKVPMKDLTISWRAVEGVASYALSIRQSGSDMNITALLPASSTSFAVPHGFLLAGKEYEVSIGTVAHGGNVSSVEATFTTEK